MAKQRSKTVPLEYPFEWDGTEISEVTVRRPKGNDLRAIEALERDKDASESDRSFGALARLSDIPLEAFDEMDGADIASLSEVVSGFFPKAQRRKTGAAS